MWLWQKSNKVWPEVLQTLPWVVVGELQGHSHWCMLSLLCGHILGSPEGSADCLELFLLLSTYYCPLNCSCICSLPLYPIVCDLLQVLSFFPWNTAGKRSEFLKAASFFPSKMSTRHVLYETWDEKIRWETIGWDEKEADWEGWRNKRETGWENKQV